jgi:hypothetical protein
MEIFVNLVRRVFLATLRIMEFVSHVIVVDKLASVIQKKELVFAILRALLEPRFHIYRFINFFKHFF